jgi:hypothetical protein
MTLVVAALALELTSCAGWGDMLAPHRNIAGAYYLKRGPDDNQIYLMVDGNSGSIGGAISSIGWTQDYIVLKKSNANGLYGWAVIRVRDQKELNGQDLQIAEQHLLRTLRIMGPEEAWNRAERQ